MASVPAWRRGLNAVDEKVAPRVEGAIRHDAFGIGLALVVRARAGVGSRAERTSRRLLHALNLPAGSDVNRLLAQLGAVERQVRDLAKKLEDEQTSGGGGKGALRQFHGSSGPDQS